MSRYNDLFRSHFAGCVLLAKAHDPYRQRNVELRMVPGQFDVVGVSDGTDAWIAPVAGDPFRVNIARLIEDARAGRTPVFTPTRRRIVAEPEVKPRVRVTVNEEPAPVMRRRIHVPT